VRRPHRRPSYPVVRDAESESERFHTPAEVDTWATFGVKDGVVTDAVFVLPNGTIVEWPRASRPNRTGDHVADPYTQIANSVVSFGPSCYARDDVTHVLNVSIAVDVTLVGSLKRADLERVVSVARVLFLNQLNIMIRIQRVEFFNATSSDAIGAFQEFNQWTLKNQRYKDTAYWMLLSTAYQGISGVAYVGSLCSSQSSGVSVFDWLDFAHEMGHAMGARHTFGQGGIMDYGDGKYKGEIQMAPILRNDVCSFLSYVVPRCTHSIFMQNSGCGDGVLGSNEQCECAEVGSTSCGACVNCKTTKPCSSLFAVRRGPGPPVAAEGSDPACCSAAGVPAAPKTLCSNGVDACGTNGRCERVCSRGLGIRTRTCGFDEMGCRQGCVFGGRCRWDLTMPDGSFLSHVSNGTRCLGGGTCDAYGRCSTSPSCSKVKTRKECSSRRYCSWKNRRCVVVKRRLRTQ
jgi:hypothetical protein